MALSTYTVGVVGAPERFTEVAPQTELYLTGGALIEVLLALLFTISGSRRAMVVFLVAFSLRAFFSAFETLMATMNF